MCSFHWILLSICMESSRVIVFDSKRKPWAHIEHFLKPLNRKVCTKHHSFTISTIKSLSFFRLIKHQTYTFDFCAQGVEAVLKKVEGSFYGRTATNTHRV